MTLCLTIFSNSGSSSKKHAHVQRLLQDVDLAGVAFGGGHVHQLLVRIYEIQFLARVVSDDSLKSG